jgi:hypothetical protein
MQTGTETPRASKGNPMSTSSFLWYRSNGDGTAEILPDTAAVRARIDAGERGFYGNAEGAIIHGGVIATAYRRMTQQTYDAMAWLRDGAKVPAGVVSVTTITAEPRGFNSLGGDQ